MFNVLYRQLWQREDCQDVIHDAYVRVWARRDRVGEETLDALIWTTALNLARNRLRWRRLWRHESLDEEIQAATSGDGDFLAIRRLHAALRRLSAVSRDVLLLSEFGGMRGHEIAALLRIPAGTVASRKHQAMARLKKLMEEVADA